MNLEKTEEKILNLKGRINTVIDTIDNENSNVFEYMRKKSLISKLDRLSNIQKIISIEKYKIVFIGTIGAGKTTAICHLFGFTDEVEKTVLINKKKKKIKVIEPLFSTGSGRTTISEVVIKPDSETFIEIEPYSKDKLISLIGDFSESFYGDNSNDSMSTELERAIRSIIGLKKSIKKTTDSSGKTTSKTIDPAKNKSESMELSEFRDYCVENADLDSRQYTKEKCRISCPHDNNQKSWLKENFDKVNKAEIREFSLPKKIFINVDKENFGSRNLSNFYSIIDTKGIDENSIRPDLSEYIEQEDTICLFTSSYNDAPETNVRDLMKYHLSQSSRNFEDKFITFVMPHNDEPENENDGDGSRETGIEIKRKIIKNVFNSLKLSFNEDNILFYDALQFYDSKGRIERDYDIEDIEDSRDYTTQDILNCIQNRRKNLVNEINSIENSFELIVEGKTLSDEEIILIDSVVDKIKEIRELGKRVPSYSYEEFFDRYIEYYEEHYRAWNTKDAIHRRLGTFEVRGIDTYFDAKVVAEGLDDDEMIKKFTKALKYEIKEILIDLGKSLDDLNTLTPEIIKDFESQYDEFVSGVGSSFSLFLRSSNENRQFWQELINRRGQGAGYNKDVCTILMRKLQVLPNGVSADRVLQEFTEKEWKKIVNGLLKFFIAD